MIKATFTMPTSRMQAIVQAMEQRTGTDDRVMIEQHDIIQDWCIVVGRASAVMYVIGEVAAHGEDCLKSASII